VYFYPIESALYFYSKFKQIFTQIIKWLELRQWQESPTIPRKETRNKFARRNPRKTCIRRRNQLPKTTSRPKIRRLIGSDRGQSLPGKLEGTKNPQNSCFESCPFSDWLERYPRRSKAISDSRPAPLWPSRSPARPT
jgi:hypothetical protein